MQYALNIEQDAVELSERTLYRYLDWLRKKDFMQDAMSIVTETLLSELKINFSRQRHDSTHVFSNMAAWSRKKLLYRIILRFLNELLTDAGFGSDQNFVKSAENGVKLIAPAPHQPENKVGLDECKFDSENRIAECPAGKKPCFRSFKNGKGRAVFFKNICDNCPPEG